MKQIFVEVRDRMTFMPVMVTVIDPKNKSEREKQLIMRGGFDLSDDFILVTVLNSGDSSFDPYDWKGSRTMSMAHKYILDNINNIQSGEVIDVEYILKETDTKKEPESDFVHPFIMSFEGWED